MGQHTGAVLSDVASSSTFVGLIPSLCGVCMSACVPSGSFPQSKNMQSGGGLVSHSKLSKGVSVTVNVCLSLYVSTVMN